MSRTIAAAVACMTLTALFYMLVWPREDDRRPSAPAYSSTVYDPR